LQKVKYMIHLMKYIRGNENLGETVKIEAFVLVFISVFMHAAWNFMSKKDSPSMALYLLAAAAGGLIWSGALFFCQVDVMALPWQFWAFFLISNCFEVLYFLALSHGYRQGDISLVYPLGRALPVILVAVVTSLFGIGKIPALQAFIGMAVIFAGCIIMPLENWKSFKLSTYCNKLLFWVLMIGVGTTGYTIFDSMAMEILNNVPGRSPLFKTIFYIFIVQMAITATLAVPVFVSRESRRELKALCKSYSPYVAGIFSASAYVLILLAMKFVTNVSYIQAFRQMSLPLGVLAGIFILKEKCSPPKLVGILLVVSGLVMTSLK